ncbi:hypothetical protein CYMTET_54188 [Cymbomonas tetramitiformis]|uniref:Reverse transcriptase domain-containing protein n=1 Tax=Cymbomonas tetramitiformis TaxID=36881 RepID=A0AAE0EPU7_9CHLO|nr:hypothetical protein CYMTET_54188 [Cymbomonas tetramitiformis]
MDAWERGFFRIMCEAPAEAKDDLVDFLAWAKTIAADYSFYHFSEFYEHLVRQCEVDEPPRQPREPADNGKGAKGKGKDGGARGRGRGGNGRGWGGVADACYGHNEGNCRHQPNLISGMSAVCAGLRGIQEALVGAVKDPVETPGPTVETEMVPAPVVETEFEGTDAPVDVEESFRLTDMEDDIEVHDRVPMRWEVERIAPLSVTHTSPDTWRLPAEPGREIEVDESYRVPNYVGPEHMDVMRDELRRESEAGHIFLGRWHLPLSIIALGMVEKVRKGKRFEFEEERWMDARAPFGNRALPGIFMRWTRAIVAWMRARGIPTVGYLDDFFCVLETKEQAEEAMLLLVEFVTFQGFKVNSAKCEGPSQLLEFLELELPGGQEAPSGTAHFGVDLLSKLKIAAFPLMLHFCPQLAVDDPASLVGALRTPRLLRAFIFSVKAELVKWQAFAVMIDPSRHYSPVAPVTPSVPEQHRQSDKDIEVAMRGEAVSDDAAAFRGFAAPHDGEAGVDRFSPGTPRRAVDERAPKVPKAARDAPTAPPSVKKFKGKHCFKFNEKRGCSVAGCQHPHFGGAEVKRLASEAQLQWAGSAVTEALRWPSEA